MFKAESELLVQDIIHFAKKDVGIEEIPQNQGWKDKEYNDFMFRVLNYKKGSAWCVYQAVRIWLKAFNNYNSNILSRIIETFNPLAQAFYNNCRRSDYFEVTKIPEVGSIVIYAKWENDRPTYKGHAAVIIEIVDNNTIITVGGNTSDYNHREGNVTAQKVRALKWAPKNAHVKDGLYVKGFIKVPKI